MWKPVVNFHLCFCGDQSVAFKTSISEVVLFNLQFALSVLLPHQSSLHQLGEKAWKSIWAFSLPVASSFWNTPFFLHIYSFCGDEYLLDVLYIIRRIEAYLSVLELTFAPTLIIFFANFGELVTWRKKKEGTIVTEMWQNTYMFCTLPRVFLISFII